jgi:hypothetical protein
MQNQPAIKLLAATICLLIIAACNKESKTSPCNGINYTITYTSTAAIGTANNGSINITAPIGDTMTYRLNGSAATSFPYFTGLSAGNYVVTVINKRGCSDTVQINIPNYGPKYALVHELIKGYCGPCHLNGTVSGNKNFDTDASIVSSWDRIKARSVDGIPSFMPQNSALTSSDKLKITDWINAGHRQTD